MDKETMINLEIRDLFQRERSKPRWGESPREPILPPRGGDRMDRAFQLSLSFAPAGLWRGLAGTLAPPRFAPLALAMEFE